MPKILEILTAFSTFGTFLAAWRQLHMMRAEAKKERTLNICLAYDQDPVISNAVKDYRDNMESPEKISLHSRRTILNYLDVIAIGDAQRSYDFAIVYPQFKNIIPALSEKLIKFEDKDSYPDLHKLVLKIEAKKIDERAV